MVHRSDNNLSKKTAKRPTRNITKNIRRPLVRAANPPITRPAPTTYLCEADVADGLEAILSQEIRQRFPRNAELIERLPGDGFRQFNYHGDLRQLLQLQTAQAINLVCYFAVSRPKALLGDQHWRLLLKHIELVRSLHPADSFNSFYISAAGSDSSVMTRIKAELVKHTGLIDTGDEGDLLIRIRRSISHVEGWDVLLRLSPRPLATRSWRVCNMEGALNATVAHAIALLTQPRAEDIFLNLACGSGSLLIERLNAGPVQRAIGCDIDKEALQCAEINLTAAGFEDRAELYTWDAGSLPLPDASVNALCADLPFGHLVGTHQNNLALYPALMREAARVAQPGARFALITHEIRLMESLLAASPDWTVSSIQRVALGGLNPRIFVLSRSSG